jgi:hypothetical protein
MSEAIRLMATLWLTIYRTLWRLEFLVPIRLAVWVPRSPDQSRTASPTLLVAVPDPLSRSCAAANSEGAQDRQRSWGEACQNIHRRLVEPPCPALRPRFLPWEADRHFRRQRVASCCPQFDPIRRLCWGWCESSKDRRLLQRLGRACRSWRGLCSAD